MEMNVQTTVFYPWVNKLCIPPSKGCRHPGIAGIDMDILSFALEKLSSTLKEPVTGICLKKTINFLNKVIEINSKIEINKIKVAVVADWLRVADNIYLLMVAQIPSLKDTYCTLCTVLWLCSEESLRILGRGGGGGCQREPGPEKSTLSEILNS